MMMANSQILGAGLLIVVGVYQLTSWTNGVLGTLPISCPVMNAIACVEMS